MSADEKDSLSLDELSQQYSLADQLRMRKQWLTEVVAEDILTLFKISVIATVALTIGLALIDTGLIAFGRIQPDQRLVTERVLLAIVGASVVQVGSAIVAIVYAIFGRPKPSPKDSERPHDEQSAGD